jgi:hypothetical protein
LAKLRRAILGRFPSLAPLSLTTVRSTLREQLGYNYKKVNTKPLGQNYKSLRIHAGEAAKIILRLLNENIPVVFVYEFHVGRALSKPYNWVKKGEESYVLVNAYPKSVHCICGVTLDRLVHLNVIDSFAKQTDFADFIREMNGLNST